jgi:hypothetical protein
MENYVVKSSTSALVSTVPAATGNFPASGDVTVAVAVTTPPGRVDTNNELMIQQAAAQVFHNFIAKCRLEEVSSNSWPDVVLI